MSTALTSRKLAATAAALLCLFAAGCGQDPRVHFREHDLRPLRTKIEQEKTDLAGLLQTVQLGSRRSERAVNAQIDAIAQTADQIALLKPPSQARSQLAAYSRANRTLVAALRDFAAKLGAGRRAALTAAGTHARDAAGAVRRADDALEAALTPSN